MKLFPMESGLVSLPIKVLLCCLCFLLAGSSLASSATNPTRLRGKETDRVALLAIKAQIKHEPTSVLSSWNESSHFCQWQGVDCGRRHQRVTVLDLQSQHLAGSISPHVGNLSFLKELYLQNNSFTGEIPPHFGHLRRLQTLRLNNNSIGGEIPANISSCSNLIRLDLGYNKLVGKLPTTIGSLSMLQRFGFYYNNLAGTIPPSFGNLSSLTTLLAIGNNLEGSIPISIGKLTSLKVFAVGENLLSVNGLTGQVPSLQKLFGLWEFVIGDNYIGSGKASDFSFLSDLTNSTQLGTLDLTANNFGGMLPLSLWNFSTSLSAFSVLNNQIHGSIPNGIGKLVNMEILYMGHNEFSGSIPADIGKLRSLGRLLLNNNKLSGDIPSSLGNLTELFILDLQGNALQGIIPPS
ncbi:hypothetical protein ACLB2K_077226 [Fragaria x ananassa]